MENSEHNRLQCIRFYSEAGALGYHLFRLRSCKPLIEMAEMKKRREESLANPLPENNPEWEEMEEVLVSMDVDGWEIYVKETRPKGQRLPNEVDPERAQLQQAPVVQDDAAVASSNWQLLESVDVALPGEPEHFEPHEVKEPEMDGELIDAILKPFLDRLPGVSDERDIDEPDADEEIVFRDPIVGGSASMFSQRKLRSHLMNKIHAVDFRLDGSGVVNILDTDVTRDPAKLELRQESMQQTEDGAIIIRRFDLTDEEKHRQMEREIFEEPKSAEEKLRAGDPAASLEIVSKAKSKAAPKSEAASSSSGIAQVIGDAVGQFIKPKTKDQATMIQQTSSSAPQGFNGDGNVSHGVPKAKSATNSEECNRVPQTGSTCTPSGSCGPTYAQGIAFQSTTTDVDNNLTKGASSEVIGTSRCAFDGACPEDCQEGAAYGKCSSPGNGWTSASG